MSYVLIVGAKSDIARAIAKEYAKHGYDLYLAARKINVLDEFAKNINIKNDNNGKNKNEVTLISINDIIL